MSMAQPNPDRLVDSLRRENVHLRARLERLQNVENQHRKIEERILRMAELVESSEDAIIGKNLDGVVESWNRSAQRVYGYSAEDMIGKPMALLLPPDRPDEESSILRKIQSGERVEHFETVRRRKDGELICVSLTISPIRGQDGRIVGASHIARDISERKKLEEQLRQTQKLESLGVLAGGIAHDFNNLLTGILGNASLALEAVPSGDPSEKYLSDVIRAAESAADLTRQLLAYAGKGRFITEHVDLSRMVREISGLIQSSIQRSVRLRLDLMPDLPPIEADAGQIQQIVMNLVINAAEAIGEERPGTVYLSTRTQEVDEDYIRTAFQGENLAPGKYVSLEVHDTGCGMDRETMARIFDPFFTTKFTGRGLGLAAVMGIVRGHKGALRVYSTPGQGSTFKVLFPAAAGTRPSAPVREAGLFRGTETVLVVDDEDIVRQAARNALERYGYTVRTAQDGAEAVEIFSRDAGRIGLVLLDLTMPFMAGEEALAKLRAVSPDVRVLLSSGFNEVEAVRRFIGKGLAGFIQKPYSAVDLARRVRQALDEPVARRLAG
jgi:PAS domain S-box-containing protein